MADCGPLKKSHIAQHLLDLVNHLEPLSEYSINLQPQVNLNISDIEKVVKKELNALVSSIDFNLKTVNDDIKKLNKFVHELNNDSDKFITKKIGFS